MIEEVLHIFSDPAHFIAELMWEGIFFLVGVGYMKVWVKKHDKEHHSDK